MNYQCYDLHDPRPRRYELFFNLNINNSFQKTATDSSLFC